MKNYILLLCMCAPLFCFAQNDKAHKKAEEVYEKAMLQLRDGLIKDAIPLLGKAIEYDPNYTDAYLSLAGVYGELKDYAKSISYYETARSKDTAYFRYFLIQYSINLAGLGRFNDALTAINTFLELPKMSDRSIKSAQYRKKCYEFAIDYAAKHPNSTYQFLPVNLGDSVNTADAEYYPSFTIDDSILVFTRHGSGIRENFMESTMSKKGYSKAQLINGDLNLEPQKGAINISQDGEWLAFAGDFPGKGLGNFDIYISFNTPTGWSDPINLGPNINTEFWESAPTLSPDKESLYFSSRRPSGYGGKDLYVSHRQPNGKWGPAQNMGPTINTAGDEQAPFIHADNQTLYFTSDGLPGYGGTDLFVIRKQPDGKWSAPENLGYPINTIENEGTLAVASNGVTAYYASDRADTRGELDLYKFDLREDVRPARTLYVTGIVTDAETKKQLPSTVELIDNDSRQSVFTIQTDETGHYFVTLPVGKDYTFTVNRKGYLFYSDLYSLKAKVADSTYQKDIALQPVKVNAVFTFKNIQFALNSYQLEDVSKIELDKLVQLLNENPSLHVQINGHTDNIGNAADNLKLSANRAKAVVDYLVSKRIEATRLTFKGFGATKPVADNTTEEGRAKNRRTEFTITAM